MTDFHHNNNHHKMVKKASYVSFLHNKDENPDLYTLRELIDRLDTNDGGFVDDMEMIELKEKIVLCMRKNQELETKIEEADRRIGSLVRNYQLITNKKLLRHLKEEAFSQDSPIKRVHGLNEFSAQGRKKLRSYEHFIYILQTQPKYMAHLLVHDNKNSLDCHKKLLKEIFGFLSTEREAYLLLNILKTALKEDIKTSITDPNDFIEGNPRITSLAVDLYRSCFLSSLFASVKPLVVEIIHAKYTNLSLDPVAIFKELIREKKRPPVIYEEDSVEEALNDREVQDKVRSSVYNLIKVCDRFLDIFMSDVFVEEVPFGMRYLCRCLWEMVQEKFPSTDTNQLIKIVAHVMYYRLIHPCICHPDVFDIIRLKVTEKISKPVRQNLTNIGKLLNAAAMGQKSCSLINDITEVDQSVALVQFLSDAHEKFKIFIRNLLVVESPEDHYEMNEFTVETLASPLNLNLNDLLLLHQRVFEHRKMLCSSSRDVLIETLDSLGQPPPTVDGLIANPQSPGDTDQKSAFILLTPKNPKSDAFIGKETESLKPIKVKQAIIELIKHRPRCNDIDQVFFTDLREDECRSYLYFKNEIAKKVSLHFKKQSIMFSTHGESLSTLLEFVRYNLKSIKASTFVDVSRQILQDLVKKIEDGDSLRIDLDRLKGTLMILEEKKEENIQKLNSYKEYLNQLLNGLKIDTDVEKKKKNKLCLKYSALKLFNKGILIHLKDLDKKLWKDAVFEIRPHFSEVGLFNIRLVFKGEMQVDCVNVELQYLLELLFKEVREMDLMEKARINVMMLLYLLNKKFYGQ